MREFFFANYRLLADESAGSHESLAYLSAFAGEMPFTHTFTLRMGNSAQLDEIYSDAVRCPAVCRTDRFTIHPVPSGWAFVSVLNEDVLRRSRKYALLVSGDYGEITVYMSDQPYYESMLGKWMAPPVPFSSSVRAALETGICLREGLPFHASLVEKDGYGVLFLGPSGMGKSTQAKLWEKYLNAEPIIGDRPVLRRMNGIWCGSGMPWDGKDRLLRQKSVPVRAIVALQQAEENIITPLTAQDVMAVLLRQVMLPMWDSRATGAVTSLMGTLAREIPFYLLKNRADEESVLITRDMIEGESKNHGNHLL